MDSKLMIPHQGGHCPLLFLPATLLSQTFKELFELIQHPSRALNLASCLASRTTEIQRHCQVCPTGCRGPKTQRSSKTDSNLDCVFAKTHFFALIVDCKIRQNRIELMTRPVYSEEDETDDEDE